MQYTANETRNITVPTRAEIEAANAAGITVTNGYILKIRAEAKAASLKETIGKAVKDELERRRKAKNKNVSTAEVHTLQAQLAKLKSRIAASHK
ncbi:MAG: hypothetical protein P4K83_12440 [Terracidiphilus sp.]|nr:hypothetical protein [Terracidiphilus sp.]